jgi:signal transduction histidine kinase
MIADIDARRPGSVTAARSSPGGIPRRKQITESRFRATLDEKLDRELNIRAEGRLRERVRIGRDLHDTLFQVFIAASMLLHNVVEAMPVPSLERQSLGNALRVIRRVFGEGRSVFQDLQATESAPSSIEEELTGYLQQFSTGAVHCEVSVTGHRKEVKPAIQEQINLIAREALVNALLHSEATCIEAEVEYLPRRVRVVVRDNGRGMSPQKAWTQGDAHCGLIGMRDQAESMGAKLTIWSRPDAGTEVELSVPAQVFTDACASDV